jgi:hypothetical protein
MSKYDGLIIPRSYNEYINKTDAATFSQASQLPNTMDSVPTANSNRAARSGGIFDANAIITANSKILSGPGISARSIIRVFFTAAITGSDAATGLTLTYNGNTYPVKATANGALKDFTPYPIATETRELTKGKTEEKGETKGGTRATVTNYVFCQAYTTIEMMFDGTQFIIIGNPAVISNSDYTVYTDGSITYTDKGVENYGQGKKLVGTLSDPSFFNFGNDCNYLEYNYIEFWLTIWDIDTYNNIVIHGFYLRDSFMRDDIVAKVGMDRTGENIYGTLVINGLNQTANKNKFMCYIKEV